MIEGKILVVDDNKSVLSALELLLEQHFSDVNVLSNEIRVNGKLVMLLNQLRNICHH